MSDKNTYLMAAIVAVFIVLIVDFDAANLRWCGTYPDMCVPDTTEIAKSSEGSC